MDKFCVNVMCLVGGVWSPIQNPNFIEGESDLELTFNDMFNHNLGRKPTDAEVYDFKSKKEISVVDREITYIFYYETL